MLVSKSVADKLKTNTLYNTIRLHSPDSGFDDIMGENIVLDSFSLEQEITEKELKFGGCIASEMSVKLIDYDCSKLIGKTVQVIITATYLESELYPSDDLYPSKTLILPAETGTVECPIFYGKVQSAQRDKKNRNITKITAYDAFYDMSKVDLSLWFAGKTNDDGSFAPGFAHYAKAQTIQHLFNMLQEFAVDCGVNGVEMYPALYIGSLTNNFDDDCVEKVIKDITLTDLIQAYAELSLNFVTIHPQNGYLYFKTLYDSNDYSWYISDNILMRCRTTAGDIAEKYNNKNLFGDNHKYRPAKIKLFSYWWLEAGDKYTVQTPFEDLTTIESFVFNKKMSGFSTTLTSKGEKRLGKEVKDSE